VNRKGVEQKLAAVVSAEVAGYAGLTAEDKLGTIRTLIASRQPISTLLHEPRSRLADSAGDKVLAEFPIEVGGVSGALEIKRVLAATNADVRSGRRMELRIRAHPGAAPIEAERGYGYGVSVVTPFEVMAEPREICMSGIVRDQVRQELNLE
jgi:adenylate cyclase